MSKYNQISLSKEDKAHLTGEKLQLVKDTLAEPETSYLSDYDIVQRFLFYD
ncbi:hypothetical protein MYX76_04380 [Desulfobacterota bacterium AH_259_B03_O07]|nr:hypothetical protein [Desulfobacterota bacterium AH_259_B03_O07]